MPEILRSPVPSGLRIAAEIRSAFAPISSSFHGKPQATAFPGIHRIPVRTPMDQPAVGARLAGKRRIDSGADPELAGLVKSSGRNSLGIEVDRYWPRSYEQLFVFCAEFLELLRRDVRVE